MKFWQKQFCTVFSETWCIMLHCSSFYCTLTKLAKEVKDIGEMH